MMVDEVEIIIKNALITEKRDLNVYHHSNQSAHIISPGSSISFKLKNAEQEDYLHISVVRGPGDLKNCCQLNLPSWVNFKCNSLSNASLSHTFTQGGYRFKLTISPGPPTWGIKISKPKKSMLKERILKSRNLIIISD